MSIEVTCSNCRTTKQVNDRLAGRRMRCPQCDGVIQVPELAEVVAVEPPTIAGTTISGTSGAGLTDAPLFDGDPLAHPTAATAAFGYSIDTHPHVPASAAFDDDDDGDEEAMPRTKADEGELDMTPMVDVTFLLLIFFMITAAFSLQKSMESPRQQSDAPSTSAVEEDPEELDMVTVQINEYGSYLVLAADWERETPGKQNLIGALKEAMGDGSNVMKLAIEVHEAAKLQALVDCMDAGTICDYGEMQVTQVEGFDE